MKNKYTKKQIETAIAYWQKQINESYMSQQATTPVQSFVKSVVDRVNNCTDDELMHEYSLKCYNNSRSYGSSKLKTRPSIVLNVQKSTNDTLAFDVDDSRSSYSLYEFLMDFSALFKRTGKKLSTFDKASIFYDGNEYAVCDYFVDNIIRKNSMQMVFSIEISSDASQFADMLEGERPTREQLLRMI